MDIEDLVIELAVPLGTVDGLVDVVYGGYPAEIGRLF
jgi:hypothetical protein